MTEFERIEKRFKQLRDFILERQAEDPDADRDDEGDGYNIARVDLHEIKLAFFALAQERDRLRLKLEMWQDGNIMAESHSEEIKRLLAERDHARRLVCRHTKKIFHTLQRTAELRGWDCFKEDGKCSHG
jgi:hypothetical protein